MYLTKLASIQIVLWKILEAYQQDPAATFRAAGLDPALLHRQGARYPLPGIVALWQEMEKRIDDPCYGLTAAMHWHPSYFGALGYGLLMSSSLRMTLERLIRFHRVISDVRFAELEEQGEKLVFRFHGVDQPAYCPGREDGAMAWLMSVLRLNYHREFAPLSVSFLHGKPSCSGRYFEYFKCPVEFSAPCSSIVLPVSCADELLPGGNDELAGIHDRLSRKYLASLEGGNILVRARRAIIELLPSGDVSLATVAKHLNLGGRSLQRQLKAEGTTFLEVLNGTREEIAREYLRDSSMDLAEITFLLGFSEQSVFSRSFKRWTGLSPQRYRHSLLRAEGSGGIG